MMEDNIDHAGDEGQQRFRPRIGPVVWGAVFLTFCVWVAQRSFFPDTLAPEMWLTFAAIGLGLLLLVLGVLVAVRDRRR